MFGVSRGSLAAMLLLTGALAGCLSDDEGPLDAGDVAGGDRQDPWVVPDVPHLDAAAFLTGHADFVSTFPHRAWDTETHRAARDALAAAFADSGLPVWRQNFTQDIDQQNVCGVKLGLGEPDVWVVAGAHYDTTTTDAIALGANAPGRLVSQGAYDDGSGTWMVVELARAWAEVPTYYSVLFCAFDGEERGLQGSGQVYRAMQSAETFPYPIDYTRAMLDFDMFGICWPVRAPIYFDVNDDRLEAEVETIRTSIGIPDDMFKVSGLTLGASDYAHWFSKRIPTAFFISNFEELGIPTPVPQDVTPAVPGAYPFWHQVDTVETMIVMAGGPDMLRAGFQTALDLGTQTLAIMAVHPEIPLGQAPA